MAAEEGNRPKNPAELARSLIVSLARSDPQDEDLVARVAILFSSAHTAHKGALITAAGGDAGFGDILVALLEDDKCSIAKQAHLLAILGYFAEMRREEAVIPLIENNMKELIAGIINVLGSGTGPNIKKGAAIAICFISPVCTELVTQKIWKGNEETILENLPPLLDHHESVQPACSAIAELMEKIPGFAEEVNNIRFRKTLIFMLHGKSVPEQEAALFVLSRLCKKVAGIPNILWEENNRELTDVLVQFLGEDCEELMSGNSLSVLAFMARDVSDFVADLEMRHGRTIRYRLTALLCSEHPALRSNAARAMSHIATRLPPFGSDLMASPDGALIRNQLVVAMLRDRKHPDNQSNAAHIISRLISNPDSMGEVFLAEFGEEHLIDDMWYMLHDCTDTAVVCNAARLIGEFARRVPRFGDLFVSRYDHKLRKILINLLCDRPICSPSAASAIGELALACPSTFGRNIMHDSKKKLVSHLSSMFLQPDSSVDTQASAVFAIGCLLMASPRGLGKDFIQSHSNFPSRFKSILFDSSNPHEVVYILSVFVSLAWSCSSPSAPSSSPQGSASLFSRSFHIPHPDLREVFHNLATRGQTHAVRSWGHLAVQAWDASASPIEGQTATNLDAILEQAIALMPSV